MNRLLHFILFLLLFSSCTVYQQYPIDVYKPGEVAVPSDAKNVVLIYRNFKYQEDTLQNYYRNNNRLTRVNDDSNLDSILVTACLTELAGTLKNESIFSDIKIMPYYSFKRHSGETLPEFGTDLVKKISETTNADLLISLETYSWFFSSFSQNNNIPEANEVTTVNVWAVIDPLNEKLIERKAIIDTVFWNAYDEQGNYQRNYQLPEREQALIIASRLAGENYAKRFYASWQTVFRVLSVPPLPDFSNAAYFANENEWDKAILLWQKYADAKNGKLAINACYNLALAYEIKDDIETALQWVLEAKKLALDYRSREDVKMIDFYQKILEQRKKDIDKLNQDQM